jgi:alpha-amylase
MRRRPEAYHKRLVAHERAAEEEALGGASAGGSAADGSAVGGAAADAPRTIHDVVATKEPGLAALLRYDRHERRSGLIHLLAADGSTGAEAFVAATYDELGDFTEGVFVPGDLAEGKVEAHRRGTVRLRGEERPLELLKTYHFAGGRTDPILELTTTVTNPGDRPVAFELAVEWNVNLLGGGHNPAAWYETQDGARSPHDAAGELAAASALAFGNDFEGVRVAATVEPAARMTWYPVETVSNSESGFERAYQGSSLLFRWLVALDPGERQTRTVHFKVDQSIDRSAAEER